MVGRASLTPGRVLALLGAVVVLSGLVLRASDQASHWWSLGATGRVAVISATIVLVAAGFRPDRGRVSDLVGAAGEIAVAVAAVVLAATRLMSGLGEAGPGVVVISLGACALLAGASWDVAEAVHAPAVRARGGPAPRAARLPAGVVERAG